MTIEQTTSERQELAKAYDPKAVEEKWYRYWKERGGFFHAEPDPAKEPYCITIPPPNITGSLHMGHALNNTVLDAMTRWHRMRGYCALCLPGTDHAGIATQNVVEKELAKEGTDAPRSGARGIHRALLGVAGEVWHAYLLSVRETRLLLRLGASALHAGCLL